MDEFGRRNLTSTPPEFGVPRDRTRPPSRTRQQTSQAERAQPRTRQNSNQRLRPDEEHDLARLQADLEAAQTSKQEVQNKYSLLKSAYKTIKSTLQDSAIHAADLEQQLSFAKNQAKHGNAAQNELARVGQSRAEHTIEGKY